MATTLCRWTGLRLHLWQHFQCAYRPFVHFLHGVSRSCNPIQQNYLSTSSCNFLICTAKPVYTCVMRTAIDPTVAYISFSDCRCNRILVGDSVHRLSYLRNFSQCLTFESGLHCRHLKFSKNTLHCLQQNGVDSVCRKLTFQKYSTGQQFSFQNPVFSDYIDSLVEECAHINKQLILGGSEGNKHLHSRQLQLTPIVTLVKLCREKQQEMDDIQNMISDLKGDDAELLKLALEEKATCQTEMDSIETQIVSLLVDESDTDSHDIIVEITAGVGGQEAMLFTGEIFEMYQNYAAYRGWSLDVIAYEQSDLGGVRRAAATISGDNVFMLMKYEGGVHRVQRTPKTEKAGRVHTSTTAVAVLPQPTEIDVVLNSKDLQIETCRATGKGGQHVNTTDSAVRIVHLPTGIVAECQQDKSQIRNREAALKVLRSRIYQKQLDEQMSHQKAQRKLQMGSGGRSEKIRTYNFNQDRITDHRIGQSFHNIGQIMIGGRELDVIVDELHQESKREAMADILQEFELRKTKKEDKKS